ncbi:XRE family transcriptional regulator [Sphaerisporangium sp. NPDC051011]|uniref:helix-turn-helix domain-containing protein n=1 Tax=Sphaerisporangium sp. NPDC051011 TaxID=3155792 RepID=UPI0033F5AF94
MDLQQIGARVRRERERAGLTQRELADLTGISQPTLARIELGSRPRLTIAELDRLATAVGVPLRELTSGSPVRSRVRIAARMAEAPTEALEAALRLAVDILVLDDRLDRILQNSQTPADEALRSVVDLPLPDPVDSCEERGRALALTVRRELELGGAPLADPAELVERLTGVDTAVVDFPAGIDGFTVTDPARNVTLIVVGTRAVAERQRFTYCHELGHLLFGDGTETHLLDGSRTPAELRCDAFARNLLAPQDGIRAWLGAESSQGEGAFNERTCALLARHFGVSLMVILIQLQRMGLITEQQVETLRGPSGVQLAWRYGWGPQHDREQEVSRTIRPPRRVLERATAAYQTGKLGIRVLAELEGQDPAVTEAALTAAGVVPEPPQIRRADMDRLLARSRSQGPLQGSSPEQEK